MKSLMLLHNELLVELGSRCSVSTSRDIEYISRRVEHEGLSFYTITLPAVCEFLEKGIQNGCVAHASLPGFRFRGSLPSFLRGFFELCFDSVSGVLLDGPFLEEAIFSIRQICLFYKKIELPCSAERVSHAFNKYIECEQEVRVNDSCISPERFNRFSELSFTLFREVFASMDQKVYEGAIIPKHGPGSTADRTLANAKFYQSTWTRRLEEIFPFLDYLYPNLRFSGKDYRSRVSLLEPGSETPTRVISVPKTLKTPRIIAIEPTHMQYMQQGLMEPLVDLLESNSTLIGKGQFLGFSSQDLNRELAKVGSADGSLATLDLSEASDRVSNQHVLRLIGDRFPWFSKAVQATRSRKADVPGHGVQRLAKFASMGSALCFPMEAMVFLTIVFMGIEKSLNTPLTRELILQFAGRVRIFGDDIIVPTDLAQTVIGELEAFGLRVNTSKSFLKGPFRESCGAEYVNGIDVSVVKCRSILPTSRTAVHDVVSTVALRNNLYMKGLWRTANYLDSILTGLLGHFPTVHASSALLGRHTLLDYQVDEMCPDLHRPLVKGYVIKSTPPPSRLNGVFALEKFFLKRGEQPFADEKHLERAGRPQAAYIKLRKVTPY